MPDSANNPIRVYADTSVYGGVFDDAFNHASRMFFDQVQVGRFQLVISAVVRDELETAPAPVRELFRNVQGYAEIIEVTAAAIELRNAYLAAKIVGRRWSTDALHVALATLGQCRVIVSWNFKHIVHFQKIPLYNAISAVHGYGSIAIHTPQEVTSL
ncbi:MAG TPA: type II toxin-antitoxin system VapC family toxin [Tepidisphaeraceae bacterium]|jgi:hypothetical protein|nr:type II toxin-antitoxin system VapC family toxin [Tepidisphaeraceae bacterium]